MENKAHYYYLKDVDCPSSLTVMERKLTEVARQYRGFVISEEGLRRMVTELKGEQIRIKSENPRLKEVEISTSTACVTNCIWLSIGRNSMTLHYVRGFIEV